MDRACVVVALEGDSPGGPAPARDPVDLGLAAPVGGEDERAAVRGPVRLGVDGRVVGQAQELAGGDVEDVDVRVAVAREREGEARPVGRPGRGAVDAFEGGDALAPPARQVLDVDGRAAVLEGDVGEPAPVRGPGRGQDGLPRLEDGVGVGPVAVGNLERVAPVARGPAGLGDVGDAGGEGAPLSRQLLVDQVRHLVGSAAQGVVARRYGVPGELLSLEHVEEMELDAVRTALGPHPADHQVLGAELAPVAEVHLARLRGARRQVALRDGCEAAGTGQVRCDDLRDVYGQRPGGGERHDGDRLRPLGALGDADRENRRGLPRARGQQGHGPQDLQ